MKGICMDQVGCEQVIADKVMYYEPHSYSCYVGTVTEFHHHSQILDVMFVTFILGMSSFLKVLACFNKSSLTAVAKSN